MARINHAAQAHRGRATTSAAMPSWARGRHVSAQAANAGRSLVGAEREAHLERLGFRAHIRVMVWAEGHDDAAWAKRHG